MNRRQQVILVTGATGKQGGAVARHLLGDGWHVRALVRDPGKTAARVLEDHGVQLVLGDYDDPESLASALTGAYGVFSVQPWFPDGPETELRRGIALANAALAANVEHFVYSSVGGADRATGIPHFESKWHIEEHIREIGLSYTIWRPVHFMENLLVQRDRILGGHLVPAMNPDVPLQTIAVDDIGALVALSFRSPGGWLGHETEIAGDQVTYREMAADLGRVIGRDVELGEVSPPTERSRSLMTRWLEVEGYNADIDGVRRVLPSLHTFPQWASEVFAHGAG